MLLWLCPGIDLFSKGVGDLYYASNGMDPYLKDKDVSWDLFIRGSLQFMFFSWQGLRNIIGYC